MSTNSTVQGKGVTDMAIKRIMECVPNFSEGRDLAKVEKIADVFRGKEGVKLLDYSSDEDHNRSVITVIGEPETLGKAIVEAIGIAKDHIDMNQHEGQHPRMGAADVYHSYPLRMSPWRCHSAFKEVGKKLEEFGTRLFLYEKSASAPH